MSKPKTSHLFITAGVLGVLGAGVAGLILQDQEIVVDDVQPYAYEARPVDIQDVRRPVLAEPRAMQVVGANPPMTYAPMVDTTTKGEVTDTDLQTAKQAAPLAASGRDISMDKLKVRAVYNDKTVLVGDRESDAIAPMLMVLDKDHHLVKGAELKAVGSLEPLDDGVAMAYDLPEDARDELSGDTVYFRAQRVDIQSPR